MTDQKEITVIPPTEKHDKHIRVEQNQLKVAAYRRLSTRFEQQENSYETQYRMPWIVFDRDQVKDFDAIIREGKEKGIEVGWSNPCFEIWLYAYFGSMPALRESWTCCSEFGKVYESKTGQKYSKADSGMYSRIGKNGNEEKAIRVAQQKLEQCIRDGK